MGGKSPWVAAVISRPIHVVVHVERSVHEAILNAGTEVTYNSPNFGAVMEVKVKSGMYTGGYFWINKGQKDVCFTDV